MQINIELLFLFNEKNKNIDEKERVSELNVFNK